MRRELVVPKLGLTMSEGTLVEWLVKPGDRFEEGQTLFVIESEKAANEIAADADGVLEEITAQAGATLPCGTTIGYWNDGQAGSASSQEGASAALEVAAPPAAPAITASAKPTATPPDTGSAGRQGRVPVTPLARRLAAERGIDLSTVKGSGPRGRIRVRDLPQDQSTAWAEGMPERGSEGALRPATAAQQTVAQRLTLSKQQIPHFYLSVEVEMSAVMALRSHVNAAQTHSRLTLNHFILAAVGHALREMPEANCIWTEEGILTLTGSDVGMAVDTDKGLLVPVLRDVGRNGLGDIAKQASDLIARANAGRLTAKEMQGGAITVSNAGMHDVTYMTSIINPGQSMILGVGSIREVFRPDEQGKPELRREMGMVLSVDHRVLDGVAALKFLKHVKQALTKPYGLLVTP